MYKEKDDEKVLNIIGDKSVMEFYQFLMNRFEHLKEYGPSIEVHKYSALIAQTCLAMYDFAADVVSGD